MSDIHVEMFEPADATDALVVVAFTSTGAAAPIAAAYVRQQLDLPLVGEVRAPDLGPIVHVQDGRATGPIRIHGGDVLCNLDKECRGLYVISGELPLPIQAAADIAEAIMTWARGATLVLCMDAVVRGEDDDEPDVFSVISGAGAGQKLNLAAVKPLRGGVLVGLTAAILAAGGDHGVDTGALVVEATKGHPDGRAAAALVAVLDRLIPEVQVDAGPLMEEAMAIEEQVQAAMQDAERAQARRPSHTFI